MTPRERFIAALERRPLTGRVPHFELVFFPTMEAFGKVHPTHRNYEQWHQMTERERMLHRNEIADIYIDTARRYEHSAIFLHPNPGFPDETKRLIDLVREKSGDEFFLMMHGDATYGMPNGANMMDFITWLYEHMDEAKAQADKRVDDQLRWADDIAAHGGLDGFALCDDYCFNTNPYLSPDMFAELITP